MFPAYFMGGTLGCGTLSKEVNMGAMATGSVKRMKAPLLPIWSQ